MAVSKDAPFHCTASLFKISVELVLVVLKHVTEANVHVVEDGPSKPRHDYNDHGKQSEKKNPNSSLSFPDLLSQCFSPCLPVSSSFTHVFSHFSPSILLHIPSRGLNNSPFRPLPHPFPLPPSARLGFFAGALEQERGHPGRIG